jgi:hypothetical protein
VSVPAFRAAAGTRLPSRQYAGAPAGSQKSAEQNIAEPYYLLQWVAVKLKPKGLGYTAQR